MPFIVDIGDQALIQTMACSIILELWLLMLYPFRNETGFKERWVG